MKWGEKCNLQFGLNMSLIVRLTQLLSHMLKSQITFHSLQQHLSRGNRPGAVLHFYHPDRRLGTVVLHFCLSVTRTKKKYNHLASSHVSACT